MVLDFHCRRICADAGMLCLKRTPEARLWSLSSRAPEFWADPRDRRYTHGWTRPRLQRAILPPHSMSDPASADKRKNWNEKLDRAQSDIWKGYGSEKPTSLYHYSTMDGICGILRSSEFWLSDVCAMRDFKDGRYWLGVFSEVINRKSVPRFVRKLFCTTKTFGLGQLWDQYIACFSTSNALDHQWKEYADESRGCAIEVSFKALANSADGGTRYAYFPTLYDKQLQRSYAERTVDAAIQLARDEEMSTSESRVYWEEYASFAFLTCGTRFKDPTYAAEEEWRLLVTKTDSTFVRYRLDRKTKYLPLAIPEGVIAGIVRGRSCLCNADELRALRKARGYAHTVV